VGGVVLIDRHNTDLPLTALRIHRLLLCHPSSSLAPGYLLLREAVIHHHKEHPLHPST
jgi:hypothetical protein